MNKFEDIFIWIAVIIISIFVTVVLLGVFVKYQDCQEIGGVLVRGIFGYECINR
jgi:ABC-type polysaccharide/polyol phosphate export permease